jgi:hypothetical protein
LMPEAAVASANSIGATRAFCAVSFEMKIEQIAVNESISTRTKFAVAGQSRGLQLLLECGDIVSWRSRLVSVAAFYMVFG